MAAGDLGETQMTSYTRLDSYILADNLTEDSIGIIHRGLSLIGSTFERHFLIRSFSEEVLNSGLREKVAEMSRVVSILSGSRGFGSNYRIETGTALHVSCDYIPGRSLAQMIEKARQEQIPFGADQALSVMQGVSQALLHLHGNGLSHGILTPESIWVGFEGAIQIIDVPFASALQSVLSKCPVVAASLARYRRPSSSPLTQDFFSLGAIFYELLSFEKLPAKDQIPAALSRATLKAAQEDEPIPPELLELLNRLLMVKSPFETPAAFNAELQRVLYDGDYSPTTFNLAYFMHTLFREENDRDNQGLKDDQTADYTAFVATEAPEVVVIERGMSETTKTFLKIGVAAAALVLCLLGYVIMDKARKAEALAVQVMKEKKAAADEAAKIEREQFEVMQAMAKMKSELEDAKSAEAHDAAQRAIDKKTAEAEALKKRLEDARARAAAQPVPPKPIPAAIKPVPVAPIKPVPVPPVPVPAIPTPPIPTPNPGTTTADQETQPTLVNRVAPVAPHPKKASLPPSLQDADISVVVKVMVGSQGQAIKVLIVKGIDGSFGYNEAARDAALGSSYTPATKGGKPTSGWVTLEYHFGKP